MSQADLPLETDAAECWVAECDTEKNPHTHTHTGQARWGESKREARKNKR